MNSVSAITTMKFESAAVVAPASTSPTKSEMVRERSSSIHGTALAALVTAVSNIMAPVPTLACDQAATSHTAAAQPARILSKRYWAAYAEMASYRNLSKGWDGPGSLAPMAGVVESALNFVFYLPDYLAEPEATVSADGTAGWFWENDDLYASVLFTGGSKFAYFARNDATGETVRGTGIFDRYIPVDLVEMIRSA